MSLTLPLGIADIERLIPHRAPMLLVDTVTGFEPDAWLEACRTFAEDEVFFQGHFPGNPVLPGVISVEAMAQTAALHTSLSKGLTAETAAYLFVAIENVRFKAPVFPGQTVEYRCEKVMDKMGLFKFQAWARCGGALVAEAAFTAKLTVLTLNQG